MTFRESLQSLCTDLRVKLIPGIVERDGKVTAVLMAYKLDASGKVIAQQELGAMAPGAVVAEPDGRPVFGGKKS